MNWVIACVFYELRPLRSEESFRQMKARTTIEYYSFVNEAIWASLRLSI